MDVAPASLHDETECPYVGLFAFDEAHARYFFGRDSDAELIAANVLAAGVMILHGPSGVGKSSVLGAAFPRALDRIIPDALVIPFRRWDAGFYSLLLQEAELRRAAAIALRGCRPKPTDDRGEADVKPYNGLSEDTRASFEENERPSEARGPGNGVEPTGLDPQGQQPVRRGAQPRTLERLAQRWDEEVGTPCIFVLDQFEQYFTGQDFGNTTEDEQFEADLARIIKRRDIGCHVLISIREDALFELNRLRARIPNILTRSLKLDYLDRAAAVEAINGPLGVWRTEKGEYAGPIRAASDLVEALIRQVSRPGDTTRTDGVRIETPYLQLALKRLWQEERDKGSSELRGNTLNELRGAGGIAESHFKDTMRGLPENERRLCANIFDRMVTPSGMKIALAAADLAAMTGENDELVSAVLEKLAAGRSLIIHKSPSPKEGGAPLFEIFHDVLARPILDWIAAERERSKQEHRLAEQKRAAEEERRRQQEELARQRAEAEREQERHRQEVARQQQQIAIEKRLKHRYFNLFLATAVLAVVAIGAAGYAVFTHREAAAARGRMLSSQASSELGDGDGRASLLLSLAALPDKPGPLDDLFWPERDTALRSLDRVLPMPLGLSLPSSGRLTLVQFSGNGRKIAAASENGVVQVWDKQAIARRWAGDNKAAPMLLKHDREVEVASASFDSSGNLLLTADYDGSVYLWHTETGGRWAFWSPHDRPTAAAMVGDGTLIATASFGDVHPRLWAADPWNPEAAPVEKPLRWGAPHKTGITGVAFDPLGHRLVSASFDGTARIWRTCDGALLKTLRHQGAPILAAAFGPDGRSLVTGSWDGTARLWALPPSMSAGGRACGTPAEPASAEKDKPLLILRHGAKLTSVAFDAGGHQIITAGLDGTARIWDASSGALLRRLKGPDEVAGRFASAAISPDGNVVLASFMQRRAYLWPLTTETTLPKVASVSGRPLGVSTSAGEQRVAIADDTGLRVYDAASGEMLRSIELNRPPLSVAMSPGGVFVAAAIGSSVGIWSTDGEEPSYRELPDHGSLVLSVAYDRFGQRLVTTAQDGSVRLWSATGEPLLRDGPLIFTPSGETVPHDAPPVFAAVFANDGSKIFAGSFDGRLRIADATTGKELPAHALQLKGPVLGLSVTQDGRHLVAHVLKDTELRASDPAVLEHSFNIVPEILDLSGDHPVAHNEADVERALELLQLDNALEVVDGRDRRSVVVVPFDRRARLGPLPPLDPTARVSYAREVRLRSLPSALRTFSPQEQQERGLSPTPGVVNATATASGGTAGPPASIR
jgi:WD40 repeat protein